MWRRATSSSATVLLKNRVACDCWSARGESARTGRIHQDARAYASVLGPGPSLEQPIARGRHAWVQCARGNITVNELMLKEGDGAAVSDERAVTISGAGPGGGELLFIDLA